jgi:exodeoxyribonuclease VII small subunit
MAELEAILSRIETEETDIDALATELRRAAQLLELCRAKIRRAEVEVTQIVSSRRRPILIRSWATTPNRNASCNQVDLRCGGSCHCRIRLPRSFTSRWRPCSSRSEPSHEIGKLQAGRRLLL